jgi:peroxiredoxin
MRFFSSISLLLAATIVQAMAAVESSQTLPDARALLKEIGQARERFTSGEVEYDVFSFFRVEDGTNYTRLTILFDGNKHCAESFRREYSYVLTGPDAGAVTDAKRRQLGLDKEAAVRAGLLKGFESHHVTSFDGGETFIDYWATDEKPFHAKVDEVRKGTGNWLFDPRVLGLTPSPSAKDTIESCLSDNRVQSVDLVGQETVEGGSTWHLVMRFPKEWHCDRQFWVDARNPARVLKQEFNGNTAYSRFSQTDPSDPIPVEVKEVHFTGRELSRYEVCFVRRKARFNIPVDSATWTLAGLKMPVGTEIIDYRISRRIGYWDGVGLSQSLPANRPRQMLENRPSNPSALLRMIEDDPKSLFALEGATWIILNTPDGTQVEHAADLIRREHIRSTNLVDLSHGLLRVRHRCAKGLLQAIIDENPDTTSQGHACYALATLLKDQANEDENTQSAARADELFQRVVERYGLAEWEGKPLGELAKPELQELRRLGIGKEAPEIEGDDLDGKKMRLSDYRGKVVVLSFWGTWCGPCMAMVPDERKLVATYSADAFAMVGVNSDSDQARLKAVVEREKITWRSFRDGFSRDAIATTWNVHSWPTVYVLDQKGIIRYKNVRGQTLAEAVAKLVGEVRQPDPGHQAPRTP